MLLLSCSEISKGNADAWFLSMIKMLTELSSLGSKIERLGNILRNTASDQIKDYQQRFSSMAGLYEQAFKELIIDNHNTIEACTTANRFFGKDNPNMVYIHQNIEPNNNYEE